MIDEFINFVIRPPRASYNPDEYLWEKQFSVGGRSFIRQDLRLTNTRGHRLECSHYMPSPPPHPHPHPLPCVVYCHGNSGCRADANDAALALLPSNITLFTLDFSGSGLSDGDYVSLGSHESHDLEAVVSYLRANRLVSSIGLWGRSMGAVTSLLYAAQDPCIAGMVLDSAFSNLYALMLELVHVYKIRLPKFTGSMSFSMFDLRHRYHQIRVHLADIKNKQLSRLTRAHYELLVKVALQYMRRVIQKKAKFDIMDINALKVAPKTFIPALFGHAKGDKFIQPHHSDLISNSYAGDKNMIKFEGDHNSSRPQFFYDSVSIFFHNVLHPPQVYSSRYEKYYDLGDLQVDADIVQENFLVNDVSISSLHEPPQLQEKPSGRTECSSYTSSNRESWGRCSSLGSVGEPFPDCTMSNGHDLVTLKAFATPLRPSQRATDVLNEKNIVAKRRGRDKFEKLEALSQRLRLCILKRVKHRRNRSS